MPRFSHLKKVYCEVHINSSVESQKAAITIQRYSVENQKGTIAIYIVHQ